MVGAATPIIVIVYAIELETGAVVSTQTVEVTVTPVCADSEISAVVSIEDMSTPIYGNVIQELEFTHTYASIW